MSANTYYTMISVLLLPLGCWLAVHNFNGYGVFAFTHVTFNPSHVYVDCMSNGLVV